MPLYSNLFINQDENENEEGDEEMVVGGAAAATESDNEAEGGRGRAHSFFQRSDSTLCLGCPPPDPFNSKSYSIRCETNTDKRENYQGN